jgi:hypothetical protein
MLAGIAAAAPDRTLHRIAAQLETMHERAPELATAPSTCRENMHCGVVVSIGSRKH